MAANQTELLRPDASGARLRLYRLAVVGLVLWCTVYVYLVTEVIPNGIYWLSYYAADYDAGFVRRGLAGEVIDAFPREQYFVVGQTLVASSVAAFFAALLLLGWHVLRRGHTAERRVVVALLIPVLPCSVTFALLGPRPELFAASALIVFGVVLTRWTTTRGIIAGSGIYGLLIAVLAFVHEAIPLEFALGSVLAIAVLARTDRAAIRRLATALAVGPGLLATALVAVLGRRDLGAQLCEQLPHRMMQNTFTVPPEKVLDYLLGRYQSTSDYHDWVCTYVAGTFDTDLSGALRSVSNVGLPLLVLGFAHGLLVFVGTLWLVRYSSRVPLGTFVTRVRGGLAIPVVALALMVPIFATGVDWIRWWAIILINVVTVYLIFSADTAEIEQAVPERQVKVLLAVGVLLAVVPFAGAAGYSTGFA